MDAIDKFLIIFIFIAIILYVISMIIRFSVDDIPTKVKYIDHTDVSIGDLVCVSYNNFAGAFVGSFTRSVWIHTGIIWVDPITNIKYVLEGANCGHPDYKNFYKIPLITWLYINRNNLIGYKKYHGPIIDPKIMIDSFTPFMENTKLEGLNPWWLRFFLNSDYEKCPVKNKLTCFESTIVIGQCSEIFAKEKHYSSYFPCDVVNGNIKYNDGIYYDETIQVKMTDYAKNILFLDMVNFSAFWQK
jgi:hypothetical protein